MTRKLIVIRHAKSSWSGSGLADHDRPLNGRGRKSAEAIGGWLRRLNAVPDQILCSSAARTRETCELLGFDAPVHVSDSLYLASSDTMRRELSAATGQTVAIIGHNPGIGEFAERLVRKIPNHPRFLDYPTCSALVAELGIESWTDMKFGTTVSTKFIVPRDLLEETVSH